MSIIFTGCGGSSDGESVLDSLPFKNPPPLRDLLSPKDPLYRYQWHLNNTGQIGAPDSTVYGMAGVDINVGPVWQQGIDGRGVTVAVIDDGLDIQHEDLKSNSAPGLSNNYWTGNADPTPLKPKNSHGTAVAGVIAAAANEVGGIGVAPGAQLAGFNVLELIHSNMRLSAVLDALNRGASNGRLDISNNSWGGRYTGTISDLTSTALIHAATRNGVNHGRYGKGIIYLWAAGNGRYFEVDKDRQYPGYAWANFDESREPQILSICAINANGVSSWYSAYGSNLLVCAPSDGDLRTVPGITTTKPFNRYTHKFGGTSSAAPTVAGVVALMLQANPRLSWRDVRLILARTARILPSMETDPQAQGIARWMMTGAINLYTGKPYRYSLIYGFGLVDAAAAVEYAKTFKSVGGTSNAWWLSRECFAQADTEEEQPIPKQQAFEARLPIACGAKTVEFAEITMQLGHDRFRDLKITLTSPSGTEIPLSDTHPQCDSDGNGGCPTRDFGDRYRTSVTAFLDEPASGDWVVRVSDYGSGEAHGVIGSMQLTVY